MDVTVKGAGHTDGHGHVFNTFGYITEINPFNPSAQTVKHTSLRRFAYENCVFASNRVSALPFYMGDDCMGNDAGGEYIYKFVFDAKWFDSKIGGGFGVGDKYLDKGMLYAAVFYDEGTKQWHKLSKKSPALADFKSDAVIAVFTHLASDKVGMSKMGRPSGCRSAQSQARFMSL